MAIESYKDLRVWQRSMDLAADIYQQARTFPKEETYGLTSQIRRSAISVPSNIAEGWGRGSTKEYLRFLRIARGSLMELETQVLLAARFNYIQNQQVQTDSDTIQEVGRMLNGLMTSLKGKL